MSELLKGDGGHTDKKEKEIFLIHWEIQRDRVQSHIWLTTPIFGENICAFPHILGSHSSYMTLHPIPSEFLYIWGKFCFLFYQCTFLLVVDYFLPECLWDEVTETRDINMKTENNIVWTAQIKCKKPDFAVCEARIRIRRIFIYRWGRNFIEKDDRAHLSSRTAKICRRPDK